MFFFGRDAVRYAVFNDMLMTMPLVWTLGVWIATRLGSHGSVESYPSVLARGVLDAADVGVSCSASFCSTRA